MKKKMGSKKYAYTAMKVRRPFCCACEGTNVEDVSVHGIHQIFRNEAGFMRYFWLCVLLASVSLLIYETYQIVEHYRSYPKATRVTWVTADQYDYPDLAFCSKRWTSLTKIRRMNLSRNALEFLVSLVEYDFPVDESYYLPDDAQKEFKKIMTEFNISNYVDMLKAIAFDGNDILKHYRGPKFLQIEPFIPYMTVCYRIKLPKINATMLRSQIRLGMQYNNPTSNASWIYDWDTHPMLMIRESSGVKMDPIIFPKNGTYRIYAEAQVYKRLSTVQKPCLKPGQVPEDYYIMLCEQICVERLLYSTGCKPCVQLSILSELKWAIDAPPCSDAIKGHMKVMNTSLCHRDKVDELLRECTRGPSKCLPECDELRYHYATTVISDKPVDQVMIWLTTNPFDGILNFEEVPTYTFDTFVSNVGGQLGLWLGASVVSVIQTILCFMSYVCGANKNIKNTKLAGSMSSSTANNVELGMIRTKKNFERMKNGGRRHSFDNGHSYPNGDKMTTVNLYPQLTGESFQEMKLTF